jgi:Tfp pilus assembly protein PilE
MLKSRVAKSFLGFTIIEMLVGIALFGLIIPSIAIAVASIGFINDRARDLAYANVLAENKIEQIRSAGYNATALGTTSFSSELPATFASPKSASYTVSAPSTGVKEIGVTITYNDHNRTRTLTYKGLITELGVGQ